MDTTIDTAAPLRPWIASYPEASPGTCPIDVRPVHEQVLAACARNPSAPALDFLGGTTSFGDLAKKIIAFAGALQRQFGVTKGTPRRADAAQYALLPHRLLWRAARRRHGGQLQPALYRQRTEPHRRQRRRRRAGHARSASRSSKRPRRWSRPATSSRSSSATSPMRCRWSRRSSTRSPSARTSPSSAPRPIADTITHFARYDRPQRNARRRGHRRHQGHRRPAIYRRHHRHSQGRPAHPRQYRRQYEPDRQMGLRPVLSALQGRGGPALLPHLRHDRLHERAALQRHAGRHAAALRAQGAARPADPHQRQCPARRPHPAQRHRPRRQRHSPNSSPASKSPFPAAPPCPTKSARDFAKKSDALLAEGYGLTEASPVVCCAALRVPSKPMSIGMPLPGTDIRFVDLDTNKRRRRRRKRRTAGQGPAGHGRLLR